LRWLADECVHAPVVAALRAEGHDVIYAAEAGQQTVDADLLNDAFRSERILLTEDKDFGELAFVEKRNVPGIVLLRFAVAQRSLKWPFLKAAIERYGDGLCRSFTVVDEKRSRCQPLKGG
jgi:predicted nuclease of predicted toxin-antitoxin system